MYFSGKSEQVWRLQLSVLIVRRDLTSRMCLDARGYHITQKPDAAALQPCHHSAVNQQQTVSGDNALMEVEIRGWCVASLFYICICTDIMSIYLSNHQPSIYLLISAFLVG